MPASMFLTKRLLRSARAFAGFSNQRIFSRRTANIQVSAIRFDSVRTLHSLARAAAIIVDRREERVGRLFIEKQRERLTTTLNAAIEFRIGLSKLPRFEIRAT